MAVGLACAQLLPAESSRQILFTYALSLPVQAVAVDWVFRALQRMQYAAIVQITGSVATLALTVLFVKSAAHATRVPWVGLAVSVFGALLSAHLLNRAGYRLKLDFALHRFRRYLSESMPLCVASFSITLYIQVNYLILGSLHGEAVVGLYSAANRLTTGLFTLSFLYYTAMAPAFMKLYTKSPGASVDFLRQSVRLTSVFGFGVLAVGSISGRRLLRLVFGPAFVGAAPVFVIMLAGGVVVAFSQNWYQVAIAAHRQDVVLRSTLIGAFTNLALCVLLVRPYGPVGAALSTLIAEVAVAIALYAVWPREYRAGVFRHVLAPLGACTVSVLSAWMIAKPWPLASVILCGAMYLSGVILTKAISGADIRQALLALKGSSPSAGSTYTPVESISNVGY